MQKRLEAYEFHIDWLVLYITNVQNSRYEVDSIKRTSEWSFVNLLEKLSNFFSN